MDHPDPEPSILAQVRERCRLVAEGNDLVVIDHERLRSYASTLEPVADADATGADPWAVDATTHRDDEATAALVIALDAVNFGSGYHPLVRKLPGCSGATTMATHLRRWAAAEGAVRAERLAALDLAEVHAIFDQPIGDPATDPVSELMARFRDALVELGEVVAARHGSFVALVGAGGGAAATLTATFAALPTWADTSTWRGIEVPLLKRAQIVVADLHRAFHGEGPGAIDGLDRLTAFADNLVPHVLAVDGVLRLDADLASTIRAGELLVHGDEPEVALRAGGVHAVELLVDALAEQGTLVTAADLDQALWRRGGGPRYKAVPRPRSRTAAY